jgi:hypothetical protein
MSNSNGVRSKVINGATKGLVGWGVIDAAMNMAAGDDFGTAAMKSAASTAMSK